MNRKFKGWESVARSIDALLENNSRLPSQSKKLNEGQAASLSKLAERLPHNGVIIADEVGMGKTRIAVAAASAVIKNGGRVAILVPPGLGFQWNQELKTFDVEAPLIVRSLDGYLNAWKEEDKKKDKPWATHNALIISHNFCNWQIRGSNNSQIRDSNNKKTSWKWTLLPKTVSLIEANQRESNRTPRGTKKLEQDSRVIAASHWIFQNSNKKKLNEIANRDGFNHWGDSSPLLCSDSYSRHSHYRVGLENIIGLGLGDFDLVVIDEAHKNRGDLGNLKRLLSNVISLSKNARTIAMTATPVELDSSQWLDILDRIRLNTESKDKAKKAIENYTRAVKNIRLRPSDSRNQEDFKAASVQFKLELGQYVLRRDKREDSAVIKFQEISIKGYQAYRNEEEIPIDTADLSSEWKQAVCAAEALSFVSRKTNDEKSKRLRLTFGSGHGIAGSICIPQQEDEDDQRQLEADGESEKNLTPIVETETVIDKRQQRSQWWQTVLALPIGEHKDSVLFNHPAILAAVGKIDSVCQRHEKVLVFGRFNGPLKTLVQLLNAREMLRSIDAGKLWPQSKFLDKDKDAISAAHTQLKRKGELNFEVLNATLETKYRALEKQRKKFRDTLLKKIKRGIEPHYSHDARIISLFAAFEKEVRTEAGTKGSDHSHALATVSRAILDLISAENTNPTEADLAQAFVELVSVVSDGDNTNTNAEDELDENNILDVWRSILDKIKDEDSHREGGFARLMFGETKPETRRLLQLAFNRSNSYPKVLVAQSVVGREGLNLHKACRTVVLIHPEWNPGVVEQQIGRVDRIGSLWQQKLQQFIDNKLEEPNPPTIDIHPVVFKGTYDEHNWRVLQERWDDLRAQLHGIVISPSMAKQYGSADFIDEINKLAPNFSPEAN